MDFKTGRDIRGVVTERNKNFRISVTQTPRFFPRVLDVIPLVSPKNLHHRNKQVTTPSRW